MSQNNTYESAYNHPSLNEVFDQLVKNQFFIDNGIKEGIVEIPHDKIRKANWLSSILSLSTEEHHQQKALHFATLCYYQNQNDLFLRNCYIMQSRTGNIPLSKHLEGLFVKTNTFANSFSTMLDLEAGYQRTSSTINIRNQEIIATKFQKELWTSLNQNKEENITISAPTSSGKSFIIQNYILEKCQNSNRFRAVYIVPSRALIYQVSASFKNNIINDEIVIRTGFGYEDNNENSNKEIIVVTPERCLKLIEIANDPTKKLNVDVIFIDEIQNIEENSRGILLEYILKEMNTQWPSAKIITAGPYLENSENVLCDLKINNVTPAKTTLSPIFQLKVILEASKEQRKALKVKLVSPTGEILNTSIKTPFSLFSKIKNDPGNAITDIISVFGKESNNIIYAPRTDTAENWAVKLSEKVQNNTQNIDERIKDLIDYLSEEVHEKYSLIRCLKKGVAFHHSGLPDIARTEIEDICSSENIINNIVCTSTLLEGVNLPAKKIFVIKPQTANKDLSDFAFGNLIGRAGRMSDHLYGSIYCIEVNEEPWGEDKLSKNFTKEIVPATERALNKNLKKLKLGLSLDPLLIKTNEGVAYTASLLRHKYIKNKEELKGYLEDRKVNEVNSREIIARIESSLDSISIPKELVALNPTIDPLLQNKFYEDIHQYGLSKWLITSMPFNTKDKTTIEKQRELPFPKRNFYGQFELISELLNDFFDIQAEANRNNVYTFISIKQLVRDAVPWIRGFSYKVLIERELKEFDENKVDEKVDLAVRRVTKSINQNVRFLLVKYFKLWSDILKYCMNEDEKEKHKYILNLSNMLEMGTDNPKALELISKGVTRTVALSLVKKLPNNFSGILDDWIKVNAKYVLPPLYLKHLRDLGYKISF